MRLCRPIVVETGRICNLYPSDYSHSRYTYSGPTITDTGHSHSHLSVDCVQLNAASEDLSKSAALTLSLVDSYVADAEFDSSAAEIVSYDK